MKDQGKLMAFLAFLALILSAIIQVVLFVMGFIDSVSPTFMDILRFIVQILLTVVVVWFGWQYAKGLNKGWKIVFVIVAVLAVLGAVGVNLIPKK